MHNLAQQIRQLSAISSSTSRNMQPLSRDIAVAKETLA